MVKKVHQSDTEAGAPPPFSSTIRESASQIWLAGLGAFAKAQEEGTRVFDALVKEGLTIQRRTQASAEEKFSEASGRMASAASDISARASGQWDKLENLFDERVAKAMQRLGAPDARDFDELEARIRELERRLGDPGEDTAPGPRRAPRKSIDPDGGSPAAKAPRKSA